MMPRTQLFWFFLCYLGKNYTVHGWELGKIRTHGRDFNLKMVKIMDVNVMGDLALVFSNHTFLVMN